MNKKQELQRLKDRVAALQKEINREEDKTLTLEAEETFKKVVTFLNKKGTAKRGWKTNSEFLIECQRPRDCKNHPILLAFKIVVEYETDWGTIYWGTHAQAQLKSKFESFLSCGFGDWSDSGVDELGEIADAFGFPEFKEMQKILLRVNEILDGVEFSGKQLDCIERLISG